MEDTVDKGAVDKVLRCFHMHRQWMIQCIYDECCGFSGKPKFTWQNRMKNRLYKKTMKSRSRNLQVLQSQCFTEVLPQAQPKDEI